MGSKSNPLLVAIVGGSGSGKSWLADRLARELRGKAARLSLDDFYLDRSPLPPGRRARINFDHPRAVDWKRFARVLRAFTRGRVADVPCYDFTTHCRAGHSKVLRPKPVLLAEGLWLLRRREIRRLFSLAIFLDCPGTLRLRRRLARDEQDRGRSPASIRRQFRETVEPMHLRFVAPQKSRADRVLGSEPQEDEIAAISEWIRQNLRHQVTSR